MSIYIPETNEIYFSKTKEYFNEVLFTIYKKESNGEYTRIRERVFGNTVYTVIAHEKQNVGVTAFDITKTLIERNIDEALKPTVRITEQLSFESCNSGGNKQ